MKEFWLISENSMPVGPIGSRDTAFVEAQNLKEQLGEPVTVLLGNMFNNIRVGVVGDMKFAIAKEP